MQDPNVWQRRSRTLTAALIISAALNCGLLATLSYLAVKKESHAPEMKIDTISLSETNADVVKSYFNYSFRQLVEELTSDQLLEDGYMRRDLALACLVEYHDFDINRALSGIVYDKRKMTFIHKDGGERVELSVFPGINPDAFTSIVNFARTERWPLTPEGIFFEMKRRKHNLDDSLKSAFYLTPQFTMIYTLLSRKSALSKEETLSMLLEGDYEILRQFVREQRIKPDLSEERRQLLLRSYLNESSQMAPYLLVRLEPKYALRRLDDDEMRRTIGALNYNALGVAPFLRSLIGSLRATPIQQAAHEKLIALTGENLAIVESKSAPVRRVHKVKEGDSLWKIARQYGLSIDRIVELNKLNARRYLRPGQELHLDPPDATDHTSQAAAR
ncbi:MAG: LysM peptidoglycan-binding domain-containing protein [Simkaniaceae bacterium]|nr:LysM peptidoglycan-binding domain-containing protein [Simkaniaceae bacterium]